MGFFEKDSAASTLDRPKSDTPRSETHQSTPSLVSHSTPRSALSGNDSGSSRSMKFKVRWTNQDGEILSEYMQTITHTGKPMGSLNVCRPDGWPTGQYKLEVLLNDAPAATLDLDIK